MHKLVSSEAALLLEMHPESGPLFIGPLHLPSLKWFNRLSDRDQDLCLAMCHLTFTSQTREHVRLLRETTDTRKKTELLNTEFPIAGPVSQRAANRLIPKDDQFRILQLLIDRSVLQIDKPGRAGKHAKYLKFTQRISRLQFGLMPPVTDTMRKRLHQPSIERFLDQPTDADRRAFAHLYAVEFDLSSAVAQATSSDLTRIEVFQLLNDFTSLTVNGRYYERDTFSSRLHTPVTSMRKDYRRLLRFDGSPLVEIDGRNFQPFLLGLLADEHRSTADTVEFGTIAATGELYEHVLAQAYPDGTDTDETPIDRDKVKSNLLIYMFCDPSKMPKRARPIREFMERRFPTVADYVLKVKTVFAENWPDGQKHKNCSQTLQKREVQYFIDGAMATISERCPVLSVHDSLLFPPECEQFVKAVLDERFQSCKFKPNWGFCNYGD